MFKLPDFKGRDPKYIQRSLKFFNYHANQILSGKEQEAALEEIQAQATEWEIDLEQKMEEDL